MSRTANRSRVTVEKMGGRRIGLREITEDTSSHTINSAAKEWRELNMIGDAVL